MKIFGIFQIVRFDRSRRTTIILLNFSRIHANLHVIEDFLMRVTIAPKIMTTQTRFSRLKDLNAYYKSLILGMQLLEYFVCKFRKDIYQMHVF